MYRRFIVSSLLASCVTAPACFAQGVPATAPAATSMPAEDASAQLTWPRTYQEGDATITLYQPQVEKWAGDQLQTRAAVAVTTSANSKPSFGVVWLTARTAVDKANRIVELDNIQIPRIAFPQDKANEPEYLAMLRKHLPDGAREVPLDHLEASLDATQTARAQAVDVKNTVPTIILSQTPALLVLIDGQPALRPIEGQKLMRVINTRALILLDETANRYYLHAMNQWVTSSNATGPWVLAPTVPATLNTVANSLAASNAIDLLNPQDPQAAPKTYPDIYVRTSPAELIQTQGAPQYTPIPGTGLLFASNTDSALFMQVSTQQLYVLVSGRWFKATSLNGPWSYVDGKALPPDFAKIPSDSPKANVLVSVPGTPQAKEALIANSIPQTATVNIADTHLVVAYDGTPKFKQIDGVKDLSYAQNAVLPVIRIDDANTFWCVQNGVWFTAPSSNGAWVVATAVPGIIYTIPVSSPLHYITYVRIYGSTPQVVYVGYTPGYMGTCVSSDGVVVYGTGYYYPAYVGTVWVGYPPTYGYGASFACGAATGFAFGFAAGAIMGNCWPRPYWGPCWGYSHVDINTSNVYHNWHGGVTARNSHFEYDSSTGKYGRSQRGVSFNPYSGRASAGGYSHYANASSGNYQFQHGGATYNPRTGTITGAGERTSGNMYDGDVNHQSGAFRYNTNTNTGMGHYGGDVYAGHDGNVYRYSKDDGWQEHSSDGWQQTNRSSSNFSSQQRQSLDAQRNSRELGQQRFQSTRSAGNYRRVGGGGGFGAGMGFRGRR